MTHIVQNTSMREIGPNQTPKGVVAFFHGYGGSADASFPLLEILSLHHPSLLFIAVNGLEPHEGDGDRQWFSLKDVDKSAPLYLEQILQSLDECASKVRDILSARLMALKTNVPLVLAGFSQGSAVALHVGLFKMPSAGVLVFSGFYEHQKIVHPLYSPPIFWSHGKEDQLIPVEVMYHSAEYLRRCGLSVETFEIHGVDHRVSSEALHEAGFCIQQWIPDI